MDKLEATLLSSEQFFGSNKCEVIHLTNGKSNVTDFSLTQGMRILNQETLKLRDRTGTWYLKSTDGHKNVKIIDKEGSICWMLSGKSSAGIRPVLLFPNFNEFLLKNGVKEKDIELDYYEYPQYASNSFLSNSIDMEESFLKGKIKETGKTYTLRQTTISASNDSFTLEHIKEYTYLGKKYVRVKNTQKCMLSDGRIYLPGDSVWIEVSPITWLVDRKNKLLISKNILTSNIRFCESDSYDGVFENTDMYKFLNKYFLKDIIPSYSYVEEISEGKVQEQQKLSLKSNLYNFQFSPVKEENILRGAIESDVPVYLHGASGEGKSSRVKQIDPNCVEVHMENATIESFVGKSVYINETGELKDIPPTWYTKLKDLCEKEPEKIHILFFEEFTNATPSVQAKVNNVVLDRILDGKWHLPKNVRIVGSGNEVEDSLAANPMTETVFNRFAHVHIKTSVDEWLKWASENHIHPAIYSFISYRRETALRTKYDGIHPNANPRKWEMASKILYQTNNPEMLRSLIGEELTQDFISFCNARIITLEDVLTENYTPLDIKRLNIAGYYTTVMGLLRVDEENVETVREFVKKLGPEFRALFDNLWIQNDETRLEILAELKLQEKEQQKVKTLTIGRN